MGWPFELCVGVQETVAVGVEGDVARVGEDDVPQASSARIVMPVATQT